MDSPSAVRIWEENVNIPTYLTPPADLNPMFLEKRVYQGSSGKVYPNAFTDRASSERRDKVYRAVFMENEWIRLMVLPEIGGRIHIGQDKTNGYDFFYRQNVIKPALVGLLGPWVSGGVEFNWPQHHRPSTFMPVQHEIERADDGSATVWLSEHEPMNRMKGMVGICLHPGKSLVEARVRLYNRTAFVQTFLWWANVGIRVHDQYQAFFPPDVCFVADHAKRAVSSFPIAKNFYYGVDYTKGVDLAWYKNIPVPTSYMVTRSKYDFFGGYDHSKKAGVVHVADRHISPGKKLWTWGNADFGHAWDRNLTDEDGPYIELMAGVYTDNQPDFSYLQPFETKSFSQFWYPIREIGAAKNANRLVAVNLEAEPAFAKVGVCATESLSGLRITLAARGKPIFEQTVDVSPEKPFVHELHSGLVRLEGLKLHLFDKAGHEIISYTPEKRVETELPSPATEPPPPLEIKSNDVLYTTGLHLEQYRHATRSPEPYWMEALWRDPHDARCNNALGLRRLRSGELSAAEQHFRAAIQRLTELNPNPYDGEPYYNLGLVMRYQGRIDEAYDAFFKATWNYAWRSAAYYALACIDCTREAWDSAIQMLDRSLSTNAESLKVYDLKCAILRQLGKNSEATILVRKTLALDPLDLWAGTEEWFLRSAAGNARERSLFERIKGDVQSCLDVALDYAEAGMWSSATLLLEYFLRSGGAGHPMVFYTLSYLSDRVGDSSKSLQYARRAPAAPSDYCFPARLEEMVILEWACAHHSSDAKAPYYLGNLLYDKHRYKEAIESWERSVKLDPMFSIPWRNLGIAYYNIRKDAQGARAAYERAFRINPADARLLYELDQLEKRLGTGPQERLARLEAYPDLVDWRDDLTVERITLLNQTGRPQKALDLLSSRCFHPWEGGEGLVSGQYVWAHLLLGRASLELGNAKQALEHFTAARYYPENLREGKHLLTDENHLDHFSGIAASQLGEEDEARVFWLRAAEHEPVASWMQYYRGMSLASLGKEGEALAVFQEMKESAQRQMSAPAKVDFFATSLPNFLLFEDDLEKRRQVDNLFVVALAELGLGNSEPALSALRQGIALDCNHLAAQVELRALTKVPAMSAPAADREQA